MIYGMDSEVSKRHQKPLLSSRPGTPMHSRRPTPGLPLPSHVKEDQKLRTSTSNCDASLTTGAGDDPTTKVSIPEQDFHTVPIMNCLRSRQNGVAGSSGGCYDLTTPICWVSAFSSELQRRFIVMHAHARSCGQLLLLESASSAERPSGSHFHRHSIRVERPIIAHPVRRSAQTSDVLRGTRNKTWPVLSRRP